MRVPGSALLACTGIGGAAAAIAINPCTALASATQDYPAFVLVAGLLLIGLVADEEGLFAVAGDRLARLAPTGTALFCGVALIVGVVTATLNLDTSVAFLTPVLVYVARSRGGRAAEAPLLYGCLLLSNAGSLLLPGSNLTNLIVLGHLHLAGSRFLARMWLPALAALAATALVVAVIERRSLRSAGPRHPEPNTLPGFRLGTWSALALGAVALGTILVLALPAPAIPVLAVGLVAVAVHVARGRAKATDAIGVLGLPLLIGLFGVAVALGTLGRAWSGPAALLAHMDSVGTAVLAAAGSVLVNNLPAASLLAAHTPEHPFALLVGLNLGPNLCVTGSLAWLLWLRAARRAGASPSLARASLIGAVAVPLSMTFALIGLALTGVL
jgi:arsenical pump membrane protein